jgi:hypothetical protein
VVRGNISVATVTGCNVSADAEVSHWSEQATESPLLDRNRAAEFVAAAAGGCTHTNFARPCPNGMVRVEKWSSARPVIFIPGENPEEHPHVTTNHITARSTSHSHLSDSFERGETKSHAWVRGVFQVEWLLALPK